SDIVIKLNQCLTATPLLAPAPDGVVDEDPAHRLRGDREVVRTVLPLDSVQLAQLDPRLVHEGGGAQRVTGAFVAELARGNPAKLVIDQRKKLFHQQTSTTTDKQPILRLCRHRDSSRMRTAGIRPEMDK